MKVKVSYTTQYEKVPKLVDQILSDCCNRLKGHATLEFNIHRLDEFVKSVRRAQEDLSLISDQLDDCVNSSVGYVNVMNEEGSDIDKDIQQEEPMDEEN